MEIRREIRPRDHKIKMVNAHKNKRIKISRNSGFFWLRYMPTMLFFLLINVKMPTVVGILIFVSRKIFQALLR